MSTAEPRSWQEMRQWQADLLRRATGRGVQEWNAEVLAEAPADEPGLRAWLAERGVHGYAQLLLVFERFGYPDFFTKSADELVAAQYADRPALRPIYDRLLAVLQDLGPLTVQTRKTYVSFLTPRRTFAKVAPVTRSRVDVGLRWGEAPESPRLSAGTTRLGSDMTVKVGLHQADALDEEVLGWLRSAYSANL